MCVCDEASIEWKARERERERWRKMASSSSSGTVPSSSFYSEWNGHKVEHLLTIHEKCRQNQLSIIWLIGDSTLDNKVCVCVCV